MACIHRKRLLGLQNVSQERRDPMRGQPASEKAENFSQHGGTFNKGGSTSLQASDAQNSGQVWSVEPQTVQSLRIPRI